MQHQRPTYKTPGPVLTGTALSFMIRGSNQAPTSLTTPPHKPSIEPKKPSARPHRRPKPRVETRTRPPAEPKRREPVKEPEAPKPEPEVPKIDPKITAASADPISEPEAPKIEEKTKAAPVEQPAAPKSESKTDPIIVIPPPPPVKDSEISSDEEADLKSVSSKDEEQEGADETADKQESSSDEDDDNESVQSIKKPKNKTWGDVLMGAAANVVSTGGSIVVSAIKAPFTRPKYNENEFYMFGDLFTKYTIDDPHYVQLESVKNVLKQNMDYLVKMEVAMKGNTMCYVYRKQWTKWFVIEFNNKFKDKKYSIYLSEVNKFYDNLTYKLDDSDYAMTSYHLNGDDFTNQKYLYFIYGWGTLPTKATSLNQFSQIYGNSISYQTLKDEEGYEYTTGVKEYLEIKLPSPGPSILEASFYMTEFQALAQRIGLMVNMFLENDPDIVNALFEIPRDEILTNYPFIRFKEMLEAEKWSVKTIV